ncbi:MAG: hypothetical protein NTW16_08700 [Bacteroidetes bacterium]|nr:hypothetical protein [Bacteroidota bacterium]
MAQIRINTTVCYWPGCWGLNVPMQGAQVQIIDTDMEIGGGDDIIFTGVTDSSGHVEGTSANWQDSINVPLWVQDNIQQQVPDPNPSHGHWSGGFPKHWIPDTITVTVPDPIPGHGKWVDNWQPNPADLRLLVIKLSKDGQTATLPYPYLDDNIVIPIVFPSTAGIQTPLCPVNATERELIVVSYLVGPGPKEYDWLYNFMDKSGVNLALKILGASYSGIHILQNDKATFDNFKNKVNFCALNPNTRAIDVILILHGGDSNNGTIVFFDNDAIDYASITGINGYGKLRLLYSTACFAALGNSTWTSKGFRADIGAKQVNANSMAEYPVFLKQWRDGVPVSAAIAIADNPATQIPMDEAARIMKFSPVDSQKEIGGDGSIKIDS